MLNCQNTSGRDPPRLVAERVLLWLLGGKRVGSSCTRTRGWAVESLPFFLRHFSCTGQKTRICPRLFKSLYCFPALRHRNYESEGKAILETLTTLESILKLCESPSEARHPHFKLRGLPPPPPSLPPSLPPSPPSLPPSLPRSLSLSLCLFVSLPPSLRLSLLPSGIRGWSGPRPRGPPTVRGAFSGCGDTTRPGMSHVPNVLKDPKSELTKGQYVVGPSRLHAQTPY